LRAKEADFRNIGDVERLLANEADPKAADLRNVHDVERLPKAKEARLKGCKSSKDDNVERLPTASSNAFSDAVSENDIFRRCAA
jgi:hypothetical protein